MHWTERLFAETRRQPEEYTAPLNIANTLMNDWSEDYDPSDNLFILKTTAPDHVLSALVDSGQWFEVEADHPKGWAVMTDAVSDRAILAEYSPKSGLEWLYFSIVDTGDEDDEGEIEEEQPRWTEIASTPEEAAKDIGRSNALEAIDQRVNPDAHFENVSDTLDEYDLDPRGEYGSIADAAFRAELKRAKYTHPESVYFAPAPEWKPAAGRKVYRYGFGDPAIDLLELPIADVGQAKFNHKKYPSDMLEGYFESTEYLEDGDREYNDLWLIIDHPDGYLEHADAVIKELTGPTGNYTNYDADEGMFTWLDEASSSDKWSRDTAMDSLADALLQLRIVGIHGQPETAALMEEVLTTQINAASRTPSIEEIQKALTDKATEEDARQTRRLMRWTINEAEDFEPPRGWLDDFPEDYEELTPESTRLEAAVEYFRYVPALLGPNPTIEYHPSVDDTQADPTATHTEQRYGLTAGVFIARNPRKRVGLIFDVGQRKWLVGEPDGYLQMFPGRFQQIALWEVDAEFAMPLDVPIYAKVQPPPMPTAPPMRRQASLLGLEISHRYEEDEVLVLIDGQEVVVPGMSEVNHPKHGKQVPLGGYGAGEELELSTDAGYVPIRILSKVYTIPEEKFERFSKRFEKMSKKAAQLGTEPPTWREIGQFREDMRTDIERETGGGVSYYRRVYKIVVEGKGPTLKGWRFIGTIDPGEGELAEGTYLLKMVPGEIIPDRFKDFDSVDPTECDYCKKARRRKKTFIVQNEETGENVQVGSNCIRDFLGHRNPQAIADYLQWLDDPTDRDDEEDYGEGYSGPRLYDIVTFLAYTNRAITKYGWMSRGRAKELSWGGDETMATADFVLWALTPEKDIPDGDKADQRAFRALVTESDYDEARAAIDWAPTLWTPTEGFIPSDYGINMQSAVGEGLEGLVSYRSAGLAASLIAAYQRHQERLLKRELAKKHGDSQHIGTVGERMDVVVTVQDIKEFENDWGTTRLIKMLTDEGNVLKWWYGGSDDYEIGLRYGGTCGVKKHDEFRGTKETTVQRCNISRMDRAFIKVTKKQGEALVKAGIETHPYAGPAVGEYELVLIDDDLLHVVQEGMPELEAILPTLPKALQKKIRAGIDKTDLVWS